MNRVTAELQALSLHIATLRGVQRTIEHTINRLEQQHNDLLMQSHIPNVFGEIVPIDGIRGYIPYAIWNPEQDYWIGVVEEYENGEPFGDEGRASTWEGAGVFESAELAIAWGNQYITQELAQDSAAAKVGE